MNFKRLCGLQALSRSTLAWLLSAGFIALAAQPADDPISRELGLLITYAAVALVILMLLVELSASRWKEGTKVDAFDYFSNQASSVEEFELSVAFTHKGQRIPNEKILTRTKRLVALQVYAT